MESLNDGDISEKDKTTNTTLMGQSNSQPVRRNAEERREANEARRAVIKNTADKVNALEQRVIQQIDGKSVVSKQAQSQLVEGLQVLGTAKKQLERNGAALTKDDLIAIIIALYPQMASNIGGLRKNTIPDLNAIIRGVIYDPELHISNNNLLMDGNDQISAGYYKAISADSNNNNQIITYDY